MTPKEEKAIRFLARKISHNNIMIVEMVMAYESKMISFLDFYDRVGQYTKNIEGLLIKTNKLLEIFKEK